jgi:hypothetical protein
MEIADVIWKKNKDDISWFENQDLERQLEKSSLPLEQYIFEKYFLVLGSPDSEVIKKQYEDLKDEPVGKSNIFYSSPGTTNKVGLLDDSNQLTAADSLGEFIDNIFDNYIENQEEIKEKRGDNNLQVEISFSDFIQNAEDAAKKNGVVIIKENSGGISQNKYVALTSMGDSASSAKYEQIGTWGRGSKLAMAASGRWNLLQTHHISEIPENKSGEKISNETTAVQVQFGGNQPIDNPNGELNQEEEEKVHNYYHPMSKNWIANFYPSKSGWCMKLPGTTMLKLRRLENKFIQQIIDPEKYKEMIERLDLIFAYKIQQLKEFGGKISISLKNFNLPEDHKLREVRLSEIETTQTHQKGSIEDCKKYFSYVPHFEPIHLTCEWEHVVKINGKDVKSILSAEILVGTPLSNKAKFNGFHLYGNGRLFQNNWKDDFEVPGNKGYKVWNKGNTEQNSRVFGIIHLKSNNSKIIPWQGPKKWGFNGMSHFSEDLTQLIGKLITRYTNFSHNLTFSLLATGTGENKILNLFSKTDKSETAPEKFIADFSTEKKKIESLTENLSKVRNLTLDETKQYISHYQGYNVNRTENDNVGATLIQTSTQLKEFQKVLNYRQKTQIADTILTNQQTIAFLLSPGSFMEVDNDYQKMTIQQLKELCKERNIKFLSKDTKDVLITKLIENGQGEEE